MIGLAGGLLGSIYYVIMMFGVTRIWHYFGFEFYNMPTDMAFRPSVLVVTTIGGFLVGVALRWLGSPGEIAAVVNNIHMEGGRIDPRQTPSMTVVSLISIISGGSAGGEAPLVQIIGSTGSWLGDRLGLRGDLVRTLTFCGMGTALGAFFGAPLGGALFALEIPHRRGLEYYEALVPTVVAALVGYLVFRSLVGYQGILYHLPTITTTSLQTVATGAILGAVGGGLALLFVWIFNFTGRISHKLRRHKILRATIGGFLLGLVAQFSPLTFFWGEFQIETMITHASTLITTHTTSGLVTILLGMAFLKMLTISFTLHSGFRGGFIFPLFFIGAAGGLAVSTLLPGIPIALSVLCMMAAVNVAVTKTPISTTVILTTLSGTALIPAVVAATFVSFVLTTRIVLIRSQRARSESVFPPRENVSRPPSATSDP